MPKAAKPPVVVRAKRTRGRPSFFEERTERLAVRIRVGVKSKYRLFAAVEEVSLNRAYATAIEEFLDERPDKHEGLAFAQPKAAPRGTKKGEWEQLLLLLPYTLIRAIRGHALIEGVSAAALVATALEWYAKKRGRTLQVVTTSRRRAS
jgi:hypothetical protein